MSYPPPPEHPEGQPGSDPAAGATPPPGGYPPPAYPPPPPAAPYGYPQQPYAGYGAPGYGAPQTSQKAIWALVLGIASFFCCGIVTGIVAIVLGKQAGDEIARSNGMLTGAGMAKAGLVLGIIGLVLSVLAIVFLATSGTFSSDFNFSEG